MAFEGGVEFMEVMDQELYELYLSFEGADAGPWNRSPRSLYLEYWTRLYISQRINVIPGMRVCNVGIGAGGWDNYLCDLLHNNGHLTSVDIDPEICRLFEYRQKREGHPNPATVVCADILTDSLPEQSFDVVTAIGSTATETGDYLGCLRSCWRLVKKGGHMMFMDFTRTPIEQVENWIHEANATLEDRTLDRIAGAYSFWIQRP